MHALPVPKKAVALIRSAFSDRGSQIKTKDAYNLLAQLWGYRDWATYRGIHAKDGMPDAPQELPFGRTRQEVENWPTWVLYQKYGDDFEEQLWILPFGATFENRMNGRGRWFESLVDTEGGVPFTVGFVEPGAGRETFQDLVVAVHVASEYPRADRYGFPMMANEREVGTWIKDSLGWGYLATEDGHSLVEVTPRDRGDDGGEEWWVEVRVHPKVHERLLTQFHWKNVRFAAVWPGLKLDEVDPPVGDPAHDPRAAALKKAVRKLIRNAGGLTLEDLLVPSFSVDATAEPHIRRMHNCEQFELQPEYKALTVAQLKDALLDAIKDISSRFSKEPSAR